MFTIGQKVRVKKDADKVEIRVCWNPENDKYLGKILTLKSIYSKDTFHKRNFWKVEECSGLFHEDWLEKEV